jgi:hypothetical protein
MDHLSPAQRCVPFYCVIASALSSTIYVYEALVKCEKVLQDHMQIQQEIRWVKLSLSLWICDL